MDIKFKGPIYAVGYNDYLYRNITLDGSFGQNTFAVNADINDPNLVLNGTATGRPFGKSFFQICWNDR